MWPVRVRISNLELRHTKRCEDKLVDRLVYIVRWEGWVLICIATHSHTMLWLKVQFQGLHLEVHRTCLASLKKERNIGVESWRLFSTLTFDSHIAMVSCAVFGQRGIVYVVFTRAGADKSLDRPGREQATTTKLGIYSTYSSRRSIHLPACLWTCRLKHALLTWEWTSSRYCIAKQL
jgi:hypothetical protein